MNNKNTNLIYKAKVSFVDECTYDRLSEKIILAATNYTNAVEVICDYFGENNITSFEIECISDETGIMLFEDMQEVCKVNDEEGKY